MGHYKKLYMKIKNNPHDVMFDDLHKLMTKVGGFNSRAGKGDHHVFSHPDLEDTEITVDTRGRHKPLKTIYVKKCIKYFDQVNPNFMDKDDKDE
jgi:predicted RNA binding protein YcfA (HicA-like mRNA interferase family)